MSSNLLSFDIEIVKKFYKTFVELSDLDFRRAVLDFSLNDVHVSIFDSHEFSFGNELVNFFSEFFLLMKISSRGD